MLSTTSITAAFAKSVPCFDPEAFQGFHLGGNVGYGSGGAKVTQLDNFPGINLPTVYTTENISIKGIDGGLNLDIPVVLITLVLVLKGSLIGQIQKDVTPHFKYFLVEQLVLQIQT